MKVFKINNKVISRINSEGTKVALGPQPPPTIVATDGSLVMNGLWTYDQLFVRLRCDGFSGPVTVQVEEPELKHNIEVYIYNNIIEFTSDGLLGDGMYGVGQVWHYVATITATDASGRTATAVVNFEVKNSWNYVELLPSESINVNGPANKLISSYKFYAIGTPNYELSNSTTHGTSEETVDFSELPNLKIKCSATTPFNSNATRTNVLESGIEYYIYEIVPNCTTSAQKTDKIPSYRAYVTLRNDSTTTSIKLLAYRDEIMNNGMDNEWKKPMTNDSVDSVCSLTVIGTSTSGRKDVAYSIEEGEVYPYVYTIVYGSSRKLNIDPSAKELGIYGTGISTYIINKHRKWSNTISN